MSTSESLGHVVEHLDAEPLDLGRQQGARCDDPHPPPHSVQERDVRARHPAVQDVAADRHGQPAEPALASADRQRVEQGLGRVLVAAVAGVDDGAIDLLGQEMNRPRFGMADDQHVGVHRVQRHRRSIRVSPLTIELAGTDMLITSPPSRLPATSNEVRVRVELSKKAIDDRTAAQQVALLLGLPVELDIAVGEVEELVDVVRRQALDPEQMPVPERGLGGAFLHEPGTIGGEPAGRNRLRLTPTKCWRASAPLSQS